MICPRCKREREIEPGFKRCKKCRERLLAYRKRMRERRPEKVRALTRKQNHRPGAEKRRREWQQRHAEHLRVYNADYFAAWKLANAQRMAMRRELRNAIHRGRIIRPKACKACGRAKLLRAWLAVSSLDEVVFYCAKCHAARVVAEKLGAE